MAEYIENIEIQFKSGKNIKFGGDNTCDIGKLRDWLDCVNMEKKYTIQKFDSEVTIFRENVEYFIIESYDKGEFFGGKLYQHIVDKQTELEVAILDKKIALAKHILLKERRNEEYNQLHDEKVEMFKNEILDLMKTDEIYTDILVDVSQLKESYKIIESVLENK